MLKNSYFLSVFCLFIINKSVFSQQKDLSFYILEQASIRFVDTSLNDGWEILEESGIRKIEISYGSGKMYLTNLNGKIDTTNIKYVDTGFIPEKNGQDTLLIDVFKPNVINTSKLKILRYQRDGSFFYELNYIGKKVELKFTLIPIL